MHLCKSGKDIALVHLWAGLLGLKKLLIIGIQMVCFAAKTIAWILSWSWYRIFIQINWNNYSPPPYGGGIINCPRLSLCLAVRCPSVCGVPRHNQCRRNRGFRRFNEPGSPSSWGPRVVGPQKISGNNNIVVCYHVCMFHTLWKIVPSLCINCTKFGQLILTKISKFIHFIATKC